MSYAVQIRMALGVQAKRCAVVLQPASVDMALGEDTPPASCGRDAVSRLTIYLFYRVLDV